jgi:hypothetical protein
MNRYWDKSEKQRAAMTREQVQAYLDVELMEKGVVKIERPTLQELEPVKVPTTRMYEVQHKGDYRNDSTGWCFATAEQAQAFIDTHPMKYERDWQTDMHYAKPSDGMLIGPIDVPSQADWAMQKSRLEKNKAIKTANEALLKEYNAAIKASDDATSGVWEDWRACRETAAKNKKVLDTLAQYLTLCDGNQQIAENFLAKAFAPEAIDAARAWAGEEQVARKT